MTGALPFSPLPQPAEAVLNFWFVKLEKSQWFASSDAVDAHIAERFGSLLESASAGKCDDWADTPKGALALVIVLDQFSRNIHRGTALAFANDAKALGLTLKAIDTGQDERLSLDERQFLYMPLMHAEDRDIQKLSLEKFESLAGSAATIVDFAEKHRDIVEQFGRFPYRNDVLGRASTGQEREYVEKHGNPFG